MITNNDRVLLETAINAVEHEKPAPIKLDTKEFQDEQAKLWKERQRTNALADDDSQWNRPNKSDMTRDQKLVTPLTKIPILQALKLDPMFVTKAVFKFSLGRDERDIPQGVQKKVYSMAPKQRMEANLARATEALGPEVAEQKRLATRKHDTAIALLHDSKVFHVRMKAMIALNEAGYELRDVHVGKNAKGEHELCFTYTIVAFKDGDFPHCEKSRAHQLEKGFASETNLFCGVFWNDNGLVNINIGNGERRRAEKILTIKEVSATGDPNDTSTVKALVIEDNK